MMHILLDSCIFRQDPQRKSAAFQALSKLGASGELTLHIPYFVKNELLTQREKEYLKHLGGLKKHLAKLVNKPLSGEIKNIVTSQLEAVKPLQSIITSWLADEFSAWSDSIHAKCHLIENHHGSKVGEAYFAGELPFRERKKRDDIPDAFIFQTVVDVSKNVNELIVVTSDKAFGEACKGMQNIVIYSTLDDFVRSESCQNALKETEVVDNFESIIEYLKAKANKITELASPKLFDELDGHAFSDPFIPDDNNEATISMLDIPSDIGLDFDVAEYYGNGIIAIPFEFEMDVVADYYIFKSDFFTLSDERANTINISEYDNRHYFEAEEEFSLTVSGRIAVTFNLLQVPNGETILNYLDNLISSMSVEVSEIDEITVNNPDYEYE